MITTCDRCSDKSAKLFGCEYCERKVCEPCVKSQKAKKVEHIYICKDCWGDVDKRTDYKRK